MNPEEENTRVQPTVENTTEYAPERSDPTNAHPAPVNDNVPPQTTPTTPAKQNGSKTWIIAAVVGGLALLIILATIIILALTVWSGPSKQEYQDAQKAFDSTKSSYNSTAARLKLYVSSSNTFLGTTTQKNFTQAYGDYKAKADGLKNLKAMKDKELEKKYQEFTAKDAKLRAYVSSLTSSIDDIESAGTACDASKASSLESASPETFVSAYDAAVADCKAILGKLKQSKNASISEYATKVDTLYNDLRAVLVETVDAYNAQDKARYEAARTKLNTISDSFKNVESPSTKIQNEISNLSVNAELSALSDYASQKGK